MLKTIVKWGAKKATQAYIKKKAREESSIADEILNKLSIYPSDAKELNKGEEEGIHERNEKLKTQKDDEFKSNQSKISTIQTPLNQEFGPKTTSSFNQIKEEKEDDLISYFKKSLF